MAAECVGKRRKGELQSGKTGKDAEENSLG